MAAIATERSAVIRSRYFLAASCIALAVTIAGFLKTFFLPTYQGTFSGPLVMYLHGAALFSWTLLMVVQAVLIRRKKMKYHRLLGFAGIAVAVAVVVSTMATAVYVLKRDLAKGMGELATSSLVGAFSSPIIFAILVTAAVYYRRRPEIHKRLILLAMIAIIWPAFARFRHYFPPVRDPELVFSILLPGAIVPILIFWEKFTVKRVHPVYLTVGLLWLAETFAEYYFFDSSGWRAVGHWLAGFFI